MDRQLLNHQNLSYLPTPCVFLIKDWAARTTPVQGAGPGSNTLNRFALIRVKSAF
jgi:hypothetical protein